MVPHILSHLVESLRGLHCKMDHLMWPPRGSKDMGSHLAVGALAVCFLVSMQPTEVAGQQRSDGSTTAASRSHSAPSRGISALGNSGGTGHVSTLQGGGTFMRDGSGSGRVYLPGGRSLTVIGDGRGNSMILGPRGVERVPGSPSQVDR